jgi:hypothetical protein
MLPPRYTDPLGSRLPALEQNMLKLRAMHMVLILFYAEEIKRKALDLIQATDSLKSRFPAGQQSPERVPKGAKNATDKALNALVVDGAITADQKSEIVSLINYRNLVGHQIHNLVADLSPERFAREMAMFSPGRLKEFHYEAVERLRRLNAHLGSTYRTHHYVTTVNFNALIFEAAERTFLAEAKRLKAKITKLHRIRSTHIKDLNAELKAAHDDFSGDLEPYHPLNQYKGGRLTARGAEICYRLYDRGLTAMAVAHLMRLSLRAAVKRQAAWRSIGGAKRLAVDIEDLPRRRFRVRDTD